MWAIHSDFFFQRVQYGKRERGRKKKIMFIEEKPDKHTSARWSRSTSTSISHVDSLCLMWCDEKGTLPLWSSSPKHCSSLIMRKISDKSRQRYILQNIWPVLLKTVKVAKSKQSLRNCHSQEEPTETWWWNATWDPEWNPDRKRMWR